MHTVAIFQNGGVFALLYIFLENMKALGLFLDLTNKTTKALYKEKLTQTGRYNWQRFNKPLVIEKHGNGFLPHEWRASEPVTPVMCSDCLQVRNTHTKMTPLNVKVERRYKDIWKKTDWFYFHSDTCIITLETTAQL